MITINKTTMDMQVVAGDTGDFTMRPVFNVDGDRIYPLGDGCKVTFTLRSLKDSNIIMTKEVTDFDDGWFTIRISSSETSGLENGNYLYNLKMERTDGTIDTLLPNAKESAYYTVKKGV